MKFITLYIAISVLPLFLFSQNEKNQFTIGFYNVENLFDTINDPLIDDDEFTPSGKKNWTIERYQKKLNDISKVISSLNGSDAPAIFGFAEIENRKVLEDLIKTDHLKKYNYKIVHEDSPDIRGIDVGLIFNPAIFKYISHKKMPIPMETEYKVRDILYTKGIIKKTDTLHLFVNHWKSRSGGQEETENQRIQCAKILRNAVDSIYTLNNRAKIIIMGDLNDEPRDTSIFAILKANNDKTDSKNLFNLMLALSDAGNGTYSYKGKWNMLDNIIVSQSLLSSHKGFSIKDSTGYIFDAEWINFTSKNGVTSPNRTYGGNNYYGGFSDHYPIYTVLVKKQ